jgi:hypothetical protein
MFLLHREQMVPPLKYVERIKYTLSRMRNFIMLKRVTHILTIFLYRDTHTSVYTSDDHGRSVQVAHRLFHYIQFVERT